MELVRPKVIIVGETQIDRFGLQEYLETLGIPEWDFAANPLLADQSGAVIFEDGRTDADRIIEFMGRLCYKAFIVGLNPNVTQIREDPNAYIDNIIKSGHGSVLEHFVVNYVLYDVSRVFTHEWVRHRVGTAISQESLRYVRLDRLRAYFPPLPDTLKETTRAEAELMMLEYFERAEEFQGALTNLFGLDAPGSTLNFDTKKKITSWMRRASPQGLATSMGWSANLRTVRAVIEQRTNRAAEIEARVVGDLLAQQMRERYPMVFADYKTEMIDGVNEWTTPNAKI